MGSRAGLKLLLKQRVGWEDALRGGCHGFILLKTPFDYISLVAHGL